MRRSRRQAHRSGCPIGITLDMLGDPWTLLVVRDLVFTGRQTFGDFLSSGEGIASNILSDRLARLEANGIVEKRSDPADARRQIYSLTEKGIGLAPVLVEIVLWATAWEESDAPPSILKAIRKDKDAFIAGLRAAWQAASRPGPRPVPARAAPESGPGRRSRAPYPSGSRRRR